MVNDGFQPFFFRKWLVDHPLLSKFLQDLDHRLIHRWEQEDNLQELCHDMAWARPGKHTKNDGKSPFIWVNYNELTTSSLEIIVSKGNHPQMALIQVSELL